MRAATPTSTTVFHTFPTQPLPSCAAPLHQILLDVYINIKSDF